ncbi:MAG: acyltransferase family protein [Bacteroidales bacterium]|nr:acyltransferase family protein [Bacteroidales bacterium]
MGKEIAWINTSKAICMIAIFYVHSMLFYEYRINFGWDEIHAFYVNTFFFVSGYLLFWKQLSSPFIDESRRSYLKSGYKKIIENILFRIVIPSIIFAIILYIPGKLRDEDAFAIDDFLLETLGGRTFWFTSTLTVAELILASLFCTRFKNIWLYIICICCFVALGFYFSTFSPETFNNDIWAWRRGLLSLIFLGLGGIYWRYEAEIDKYLLNIWSCIILFTIMVVMLKYFGERVSSMVSMLDIKPLGIIPSTISIILIIKLSKVIPKIHILQDIGKNTLGLYFMCGGMPYIVEKLYHSIFPEKSVVGLIIVFIFSFVISYLVVIMLNRFLPYIFDIRLLFHKNKNGLRD